MKAFRILGPAALLVASCDNRGPEMGAGPVFTVIGRGGTVAWSTNPGVEPEIEDCLAGRQGDPGRFNHLMRGANGRDRLVFVAADVSGIRRMEVVFEAPGATVHSPALPVEDRASHGGGTFRAYAYEFDDPAASGRTHSIAIDLTARRTTPPGLPIAISATDGAGNTSSGFFFAGPASAICGG